MNLVMRHAGKYIRHGAAWLVGLFVAFLAGTLGVEVTDGHILALTEGLTALGVIIIGITYSFTEKALKRFRFLDPAAWAERFWANDTANTLQHVDKETAESKIRSGRV